MESVTVRPTPPRGGSAWKRARVGTQMDVTIGPWSALAKGQGPPGIDVMAFANRGLPMQDPDCVRCSECVQSCPTGVLRFGEADRAGRLIRLDSLIASPLHAREGRR